MDYTLTTQQRGSQMYKPRDMLVEITTVKVCKELDPFWRSYYAVMKAHYENTEFEFCEVCCRPFDRTHGGWVRGVTLCGPCDEDFWEAKRELAARRRC
jgi:hypothetical protein